MRNSKTKGFTLIELIVVMAIIGVLAAILVPSMIGYLNDSKYSKANANAKQVYQSAANWCTKCETNNKPCTAIAFTAVDLVNGNQKVNNSAIAFDGADAGDMTNALICYMGGQNSSGYGGVAITDSAPVFAQWAGAQTEAASDKIFGEYPQNLSAHSTKTWGTETSAANA